MVTINEFTRLGALAIISALNGLRLATTYVTVHAKTSLIRTKIEIDFLSPAYSYTH